jgi:HlyD family secretion protein
MASPRIGPRGPKRPSDIEVLEMTIKLDGDVPLLPGMRVDAFVRPKN